MSPAPGGTPSPASTGTVHPASRPGATGRAGTPVPPPREPGPQASAASSCCNWSRRPSSGPAGDRNGATSGEPGHQPGRVIAPADVGQLVGEHRPAIGVPSHVRQSARQQDHRTAASPPSPGSSSSGNSRTSTCARAAQGRSGSRQSVCSTAGSSHDRPPAPAAVRHGPEPQQEADQPDAGPHDHGNRQDAPRTAAIGPPAQTSRVSSRSQDAPRALRSTASPGPTPPRPVRPGRTARGGGQSNPVRDAHAPGPPAPRNHPLHGNPNGPRRLAPSSRPGNERGDAHRHAQGEPDRRHPRPRGRTPSRSPRRASATAGTQQQGDLQWPPRRMSSQSPLIARPP